MAGTPAGTPLLPPPPEYESDQDSVTAVPLAGLGHGFVPCRGLGVLPGPIEVGDEAL